MMRAVRHAFVVALVAVAIAPAVLAAEGQQTMGSSAIDVVKTPAPPAGPVPIPYPNFARVPASCRPSVEQAFRDLDAARMRLEEAKKKAAQGPSQADVDRALVGAVLSECCLGYNVGVSIKTASFGGGGDPFAYVCNQHLSLTRASVAPYRGEIELARACFSVAQMAADGAVAAGKGPVSDAVKQALADIARANQKLAAAESACANAVGAPAPPSGSSAPTAPAAPPPPVGPNGSCDATHLCGAALACRDGKCRLPCGCALPCFAEDGACKKNVTVTRTVRKACAVCVPPCSKDPDGVCRSDTTEVTTEKQACAPVCP